jgi:G3E family GTPase
VDVKKMEKTKIIMVGGHFASGKTTLLMKLLGILTKRGYKVGLLMNDVGPVDYKMVASLTNCSVEEVSKHCMCMKPKDLKEALRKLLTPDHNVLLVEEIGFGNPYNCWNTLSEILQAIHSKAELSPITVMVDAEYLLRSYQGFVSTLPPIMEQQLSEAELIVVNKVDLQGPDSLNRIKEIIVKVNERAKIFFTSALTGIGIDSLIPELIESKWQHGKARSSEGVLQRRTQYFTDMSWVAYRANFELKKEEIIQNVVGDLLIKMGKGIIARKGEIVRVKAYSDESPEKTYASLTPDLRVEFRPSTFSTSKIKIGKLTISCVVKGLEISEVSAALKEALTDISKEFLVSRV